MKRYYKAFSESLPEEEQWPRWWVDPLDERCREMRRRGEVARSAPLPRVRLVKKEETNEHN